MTTSRTSLPLSQRTSATAWILVAFGLLAVGLVAGGVAGSGVASWVVPFGGFVGYVLAFRQGLLAWSRGEIDRIWRDRFDAPSQQGFFEAAAPSRPGQATGGGRSSLVRGRFPAHIHRTHTSLDHP